MAEQRLPIVNSDDGTWGDILRQYLLKEHYNGDADLVQVTSQNGGHKTVTIQPGTTAAGTAPLKFTSGSLMTTAEAGAMEFNTDTLYFTQTTSTTRKKVAIYDDSAGATGDVYYRNSSGYFTKLAIGSTNDVLTVVGGIPSWQAPVTGTTLPVADTTAVVKNNTDNTKQLRFDLASISTGQTRVLTVPNATTTIVGTDVSQILTNKTINAPDNTITNVAVTNLAASAVVIESEGISSNDNDTTLPTSAAVKDYTDTAVSGRQGKFMTGTVATAAATAAKTVTLDSPWASTTPASGDFLLITFTLGTGVSSPTLAVNGGSAFPIRTVQGGTSSTHITTEANAAILMFFDGTYYRPIAAPTNTTYSAISDVEITNTASTTARLMTGQRAESLMVNEASVVRTLANKTLTTPTITDFTNSTHTHTNNAGGGQLNITTASNATGTPSSSTYLRGDNTWSTITAGGDASTNTATSVINEVVLFADTGGKTLKRATGNGIAKLTSGVLGTATSGTDYAPATSGTSILKGDGFGGFSSATAGTDYYNPGGTDVAVADGGTGRSSHTAYGLIAGGTGSTTAQQSLAAGAATEILVGGGASALPVWTTATGSGAPVRATSPSLTTPNLGTPSALTLTNATGLPVSTGISGLGTNVATFLATPSSANLRAALTDEVGTGAAYFVGGALGTPASATLTNATGLPVSGITASTSTALGVGSLELGHASDTTLSRSAAGVLAVEGIAVPTISSADVLTNKTLTNPNINNYVEGVVAKGTVTTASTIDLTNGTVQTATLTASTACTFTMPTATAGKSFVLYLKQAAATGNGSATFTGVKWPSGGAPTITATAGKMDILSFTADGTNWYGSYVQGFTP